METYCRNVRCSDFRRLQVKPSKDKNICPVSNGQHNQQNYTKSTNKFNINLSMETDRATLGVRYIRKVDRNRHFWI